MPRTKPKVKRVNLREGELHVETALCVINIKVGLFDDARRDVNAIEVIPDNGYADPVVFDHSTMRVVLLHKGEKALPAAELAPGVKDPASMSHAELVEFVVRVQEYAFLEEVFSDQRVWDRSKECAGDFVRDVCNLLHEHGLAPEAQ